jgi:probable rRNA maturation factor
MLDLSFTIEISVKLADDDEVQTLNKQPIGQGQADQRPLLPDGAGRSPRCDRPNIGDDGEVLLGDIVLATRVRARRRRNISLADHATHLIIHGTLHLLGYDHENDREAEAMEAIETRALASLGLADPYGDRDLPHDNRD